MEDFMGQTASEAVVQSPNWLSDIFALLGLHLPPEAVFFIWAVILFTCIAVLGQAAVIFMVLMERKVLAYLTQRKGPNRVGPFGTLQTLADGVKLLFKEDVMTPAQDKLLFTLAPAIFFLPVFVLYALIPFTDNLIGANMPTGALLIFALSSISVVGMVLAGWASNNKYSLLGGMRSAAQAISYEIPLVLAVLGVVVYAGSMNLKDIVEIQNVASLSHYQITQSSFMHVLFQHLDMSDGLPFGLGFLAWNAICLVPITFLIFLISSIAEVNRIPFDLPEAESELVSGYNTEYSGMKFALFFLAEYAALFAMSALTVIFFFGGYYSPFGGLLTQQFHIDQLVASALHMDNVAVLVRELEMIFWGMSKTYLFIFLAMWLRGTLPRLKPDQLMGFSWKFLIPLSLINLFMIGFQRMYVLSQEWVYLGIWAVVLFAGIGGFFWGTSRYFNNKLKTRFSALS